MSAIEKWIAGKSAVPFNQATAKIAPKAIKGGTAMPKTPHERMAHARAAKGKTPKAVKVKPPSTGTFTKKAKGTGPVQVPSDPVVPLTNTATNTTAGNTRDGLHIHIHTNGGY